MKKPEKTQMKKIHKWLRAVIRLLFFLFFPAVFTSSFSGVKYIFTQLGSWSGIEMTSFLAAFIALCVYTAVFGRFFCGYACAFGSMGDALRALYVFICKRLKKKPVRIKAGLMKRLSLVKYVVLAAVAVLCFTGYFSKLQGTSPWDVFSMILAGHIHFRGYSIGIVFLILIAAGMCLQERFFCRVLCPMGAVFSILPVWPAFGLRRDSDECIGGCHACSMKCPSDINLSSKPSPEASGDCFWCQKCIDTCPKGNIHTGLKGIKGNGIVLTVLRAAILLGLFLVLGL